MCAECMLLCAGCVFVVCWVYAGCDYLTET